MPGSVRSAVTAGGAGPAELRRFPRPVRWRRTAAAVGVAVAAAAVGAVVIVLLAAVTTQPGALIGAGLATTGLVAAAALLRLRFHRRTVTLVAILTVVVQAMALLVPLGDEPAPTPAGVEYWDLPTGSRLGYLHRGPTGARRSAEPVVVLHGGPGLPDLAGDLAYFGRLADLGHDVYVYAQLGSGPSDRLGDPRGYGVDRDVADLEAIRTTLRVDRMILIGHSYGGALAGHYLAGHPDRVAALVLTSPGPLDPADRSTDQASARLGVGDRLRTYAAVAAPRAALGYALLQRNPQAAHRYLGDAEADARNDRVLTAAAPALHCRTTTDPSAVQGSGFYAWSYPQSATAPPRADIRPWLAGNATPTLIVKGSCDYLSWGSALDYRRALPRSWLVYLPGAGHNLYADRPELVLTCIERFLTGGSLPVAPYTSDEPPDGYGR